MAEGTPKKAKLAHEKKKSGSGEGSGGSRFSPSKVISEIAWPDGQRNVVVDLDGNGTIDLREFGQAWTESSGDLASLVPMTAEMQAAGAWRWFRLCRESKFFDTMERLAFWGCKTSVNGSRRPKSALCPGNLLVARTLGPFGGLCLPFRNFVKRRVPVALGAAGRV